MTDDELIARLRNTAAESWQYIAAERLENLRRESERSAAVAIKALERAQMAEDWRDHDKVRAEAAEAKVVKLVGALLAIARYENRDAYYEGRATAPWYEQACTALAEIEGGE